MSNFSDVWLWHRAAQIPVAETPIFVPEDRVILRESLIKEETKELFRAMFTEDIIGIADGIADSLVVIYGAAVEYGIPADRVFSEVMRSNWTKIKGAKWRADGKLLKGPYYIPPDLSPILFPKDREND